MSHIEFRGAEIRDDREGCDFDDRIIVALSPADVEDLAAREKRNAKSGDDFGLIRVAVEKATAWEIVLGSYEEQAEKAEGEG